MTDTVAVEQARDAEFVAAREWLRKRWHQEWPNEAHCRQLADYAKHLAALQHPGEGVDDWSAGREDCDGNELTMVRVDELRNLKEAVKAASALATCCMARACYSPDEIEEMARATKSTFEASLRALPIAAGETRCGKCGGAIEVGRQAWADTCSGCSAEGCPVDPAGDERCDACDCKAPLRSTAEAGDEAKRLEAAFLQGALAALPSQEGISSDLNVAAQDYASAVLALSPPDVLAEFRAVVEAVFAEDLGKQASRLGISAMDFLSPGRWRDAVRKAALLAKLDGAK